VILTTVVFVRRLQNPLCFFEILLSYESSRPEFYDFGVDKILDINVYPEMQTIIFIKKALQK